MTMIRDESASCLIGHMRKSQSLLYSVKAVFTERPTLSLSQMSIFESIEYSVQINKFFFVFFSIVLFEAFA